jgi:HlyD family secretion protein
MNSSRPTASSRGNALKWTLLVVVLLAGLGAALGAKYLRANGRGNADNSPTFVVARGPLTISVAEAGTIKAKQVEIIKSELEGSNTIIYLVPEGTRVKKGDLLFELDASKLQDSLLTQEITVQNAYAALIAAKEALDVARSQGKSDVSAAQLAFDFAKEDLEKYKNGDYPTSLREAKSKIAVAQEEVERTREVLRWSKVLYEEKYVSASDLQKDSIAHNRANLDLELARGALDLLENYTYKRQIAQLASNVEQTDMALERVKRKAESDTIQAEANLKAKQSEYDRQVLLLDKTKKSIDKAKVHAPFEGLVVYATTGGGGGFRGNNEPIAEGQAVRERQEIIHLPTANQVMAETKVHESSLSKVRIGLPVRVTVDAVPGAVFWGKVAKIAQMPDSQSFWQNPDLKVYNTEIHLDGEPANLRTGMTCRAEILVEEHPDAVYVPIQAVTRHNGKPMVYVRSGDGFTPRPISLGLDNNRMAHIRDGLKPGEVVLLNPPLTENSNERPMEGPTTRPAIPPLSALPETPVPAGPGAQREGPAGASPADGGPNTGRAEGRRGSRGNMTPQQIEEMRKRFENMSEEDRQKWQERRRQREQGGRGRGTGGGPGAGDSEN